MIKLGISIIIALFIPLNTGICNILRPSGGDLWWQWRLGIYSVIMAWFCYLTTSPVNETYKKHLHFVMYIAIAWTSSDAIDRWLLDTRVFTPADIAVTVVAVILGMRKFYPDAYYKIKINVDFIKTLFTRIKRD